VIARLAYAALFAGVLPLLLVLWARRVDQLVVLPALHAPVPGIAVTLAGAILMLTAGRDLWVKGGGLPMSPFPPQRLVESGIYRVLAHPIYVGAVLVALGLSLVTGSAAGLWVVTPTLTVAMSAWVLGYERDATRARHGRAAAPLLRLPPSDNAAPTPSDRASLYLLVLLPWLFAYLAVEYLGTPADARSAYLDWESRLRVIPWTEAVYALAYPFVTLAPLIASRRSALRWMAVHGLWAIAVIIPFYLVFPIVADAKPVPGAGFWQELMRWERLNDEPVTAFPAFHVIWTWLAARVYADRWPRIEWIWWGIVAAVSVSSVTTGMHAVADVAAAVVFCMLLDRGGAIWRAVRRASETVANSWRETTMGPARFLSHGVYAAVGAVSGLVVAASLAGSHVFGWLLAMTAASVIGAVLWAQLVEGSPEFLRPYGYFGSVLGTLAVLLIAALMGANTWLIFTAYGVGTTVTQAVGRLRCLVQGCCHGREAPAWAGIRYTHPRSRVVRLAQLGGVPLHPTPVYSLIWTLVVGVLLCRLWMLGAPLQIICGTYFILIGAGRFVEEHYRGEPQTAAVGGLRLYQWLAIAFVIAGAALTAFGASPAPPPVGFDPNLIPTLVAVGLAVYVAYGVDFPASNRRFARLV
jgi:protein-S-isoprenylcysteine O-methyltransferase Ste14